MYDYNKVDEFLLWAENVIKDNDSDIAFQLVTSVIDKCEDIYLNEYIQPLNLIRHRNTHDWIESAANRINNVSTSWGHLAASAYFTWNRAEKWLNMGRPLSLIALDAIYFCTTRGERLNQSPWMRNHRPTLADDPRPNIVAKGLQRYLKSDNVHRTRTATETIINNIFEEDNNSRHQATGVFS